MEYRQDSMYNNDELLQKAAILLNLVGGRRDLYASRYYNAFSKRSGYSAPCAYEFQKGVCYKARGSKKKIPCALCENRRHYKLTTQVVAAHLDSASEYANTNVAVYPLQSNAVTFVLFRLTDKHWLERAKMLNEVCAELNIQLCVERDMDDNGRCWIFFDTAVNVGKARRLACSIVTRVLQRNHSVGFGLYDGIYPNQTRQIALSFGYGTPLPLPLQTWAVIKGRGIFVNDAGYPLPRQWEYLSSIRKLSVSRIDEILKDERPLGMLVPECGVCMTAETTEKEKTEIGQYINALSTVMDDKRAVLPRELMISNGADIRFSKAGFSEYALDAILRLAAYANPQYAIACENGRPVLSMPLIVCDASETDTEIILPRGCAPALLRMLKGRTIITATDIRFEGNPIHIDFNGELRDEQKPAVDTMEKKNTGILNVPTAFGKTVSAAALICRKKVNTLIIVPTNALLGQWVESLNKFIVFHDEEPVKEYKNGRTKKCGYIGRLGNNKDDLHGIIDVATMQSIYNKDGGAKDLINNYGCIIVDECHHLSAETYKATLQTPHAKYIYGLTATAKRSDGHQNSVYFQLGGIRYSVKASDHAASKHKFTHTLIPCFTDVKIEDTRTMRISDYYDALCNDEQRNRQIINNVLADYAAGRAPIILTERKEHVQILSDILRTQVAPEYIYELTGSDTAKNKTEKMEKLREYPADKPLIVVATGKYVGEGLDIPRLSALHVVNPVVWKGTIAQYAGRLHRDYEGKDKVLIYDYMDANLKIPASMFCKRLVGYVDIGYLISALDSDRDTLCEVLTEKNVSERLVGDIQNAKRNIAIVSPRVNLDYLAWYKDALIKAASAGVNCYIVTSSTDYYRRDIRGEVVDEFLFLQSHGIKISFKDEFPLSGVVIDREIGYYGSYEYLRESKTDTIALRAESPALCTRLLSVMSGAK